MHSDRQIGFGVGPIPFLSIDRYAARFGYDDPDDFSLLLHAIQAMDAKYLEIKAKQRETEQ